MSSESGLDELSSAYDEDTVPEPEPEPSPAPVPGSKPAPKPKPKSPKASPPPAPKVEKELTKKQVKRELSKELNGNIPVVPKFYWGCELYCAGDKFGHPRTEITQEQARCILGILRNNKRWLFPEPKPASPAVIGGK